MKLCNKALISLGAVLALLVISYLVFFSREVLHVHTVIAYRLQWPLYSRFVIRRLISTGEPVAQRYAAEMLLELGRQNLQEAERAASLAIQQESTVDYFVTRGGIRMRLGRYLKAREDYEAALRLRTARKEAYLGLSPAYLSNLVFYAAGCEQAHSNAWSHFRGQEAQRLTNAATGSSP
jgi:tetratricopeptide (TPR) repeat protein